MTKGLERDLGLYATITISIGAMVGSGIFVLPGLASKIAGPAVILAYLLAGALVLPAALSKAEMATAMPESGGTYLYIDRAMGPLAGTITGVGAWFSLVFKSAFALVGLGSYLLLFVTVPSGYVTLVGLGLGVLLVIVNVVGVKHSGRLQSIIVSLVLLALVVFIADGLTYVSQPRFHPFFATGLDGLFAATGFVFVSYAGVTKVASVAEEVERPGRNIPIAILGSVGVMLLVYTFVVYVIVGVSPVPELYDTLTPMADAAGQFLGPTGRVVIAVVAVLALTSMANAGILSSARFPFAMSRDALAPKTFSVIHDRFQTPVYAIGFTGAILLILIAFVPVVQLAKLASAFQILVFAFVNAALIAFRESKGISYEPTFIAPGYPWVQLFGIIGGIGLITQMGAVPLGGALGMLVVGFLWYRFYGRSRTDREGAALDAIRRSGERQSLAGMDESTGRDDEGVLVAVDPGTPRDEEYALLEVASSLVERRGGHVDVVRFEEVPAQYPLAVAASRETPADRSFEQEIQGIAHESFVPVDVGEVVSHEIERSVVNYAKNRGTSLIVGAWEPERFHGEFLGHDVDWYMKYAPVDFVFVRERGLENIDDIAMVADRGPFDPLEIEVADAIATRYGGSLRFVYSGSKSVTDEELAQTEQYLKDVGARCTAPASFDINRSTDRVEALIDATAGADLVVMHTSAHHLLYDVVFGAIPDRLAAQLECTVVLVHSHRPRRHRFLRYLIERIAY